MKTNKKIKVLQTIRQGKIGGGESHLLNLVRYLDRSKFEPVVLSFTDGPMIKDLLDMNVKTHIIHTERPFDFTKWKAVKQLLLDEKIDIIHAHGTRANSNIIWAARSLNIPVIYTIHGWSFHQDQNSLVKKFRIMGEKYLTSRTNLNISVSKSNQNSGKKLIKSFKSRIVHYGIDTNRFNINKSFKNIREELNIPKDKVLLLFIARFTSHKQPLALIEAYAKALRLFPDMHLLMVGDGDQKKQALAMVDDLKINEHITFENFRNDVPDVLAAADIFILPSLWEGLPIALLEALTMGKAIIASNVDGTCDVIVDRENGLLVETEGLVNNLVGPIVELSREAGLRKKFEKNALQTVEEKFNVVDMTHKIENIYEDILETSVV